MFLIINYLLIKYMFISIVVSFELSTEVEI